MKKWIFTCLLLLSCNKNPQHISNEDIENVSNQGLRVERPSSQPSSHLNLSSENSSIYQAYFFEDFTSVIAKIQFDTNLSEGSSEPKQLCLSKLDTYGSWFQYSHSIGLEFASESFISDHLVQYSFRRTHQGKNIKSAYIDCVFHIKDNGQFAIREIVNNGSFHLPIQEGGILSSEGLLEILPEGELLTEPREEYLVQESLIHAVSVVDYKNEQGQVYTIYVSQHTGAILQGAPLNLHVQPKLLAHAYRRNYQEEVLSQDPMPLTKVIMNGLVGNTGLDGQYNEEKSIEKVFLESERVVVYDTDQSPVSTENVEHGAIVTKVAAETQDIAGMNSYLAIHRVNKFVRRFLSPQEVPFLDKQMKVYVNQEGECNAFYSTRVAKISLFSEGHTCANLATVNDVIYHEWGHGLDDFTGREQGVQDGAFSEGIGDIISAYINQDSIIGLGFVKNTDYGIRDLRDHLSYPDDIGGVHREGGIIAGAFWDLNQSLKARYGAKMGEDLAATLFFKHLLITDSYLESYDSLIRIDDDDGNPSTRSPNYCLINEVFSRRGLAEPVMCTDGEQVPYESDEDLNLALYDLAMGQVGLVASAQDADQLHICFGSQYACLSQGRVHFSLQDLVDSDSRSFFAYQGAVDLGKVSYVTLVKKNESGEVLSSRLLKVFSK